MGLRSGGVASGGKLEDDRMSKGMLMTCSVFGKTDKGFQLSALTNHRHFQQLFLPSPFTKAPRTWSLGFQFHCEIPQIYREVADLTFPICKTGKDSPSEASSSLKYRYHTILLLFKK